MRETSKNPIHEYTHLRAEGYGPNEALQLVWMTFLAPQGLPGPGVIPESALCLRESIAKKLVGPADPTRHTCEGPGPDERDDCLLRSS